MKNKSWIVYGPPCTGKTTNARALADMLKCQNIVDDWDGSGRSFVEHDTLYLTNTTALRSLRRVLSIETALALLEDTAEVTP